MDISVIGAGYAGLVTAAGLAELGHSVRCLDIDAERIAQIRVGDIPLFEPGLDELVSRNLGVGRLTFTTQHDEAVPGADIVLLVVGTPSRADGSVELSHLFSAADAIASRIEPSTTVVVKSTVPVGTTRMVIDRVGSSRPDWHRHGASNPEFLRQGAAVGDFLGPDRIVVGVDDEYTAKMLADVYAPLVDKGVPLNTTGIESAEIIKQAANALLAVRLSFVNEIADLCEASGGDIREVVAALGMDPRIGEGYLSAGPGFGGACLPKDTRGLVHTARDRGVTARVAEAALEVNLRRSTRMVRKVEEALGVPLAGARVAALGVTFKAGTDDVRESPALAVIEGLAVSGAEVILYDPKGLENARSLLPGGVTTATSAVAALTGADAAVLLTDWDEFRSLDLAAVAAVMRRPVLVDLRNSIDASAAASAGLEYDGVGRAAS